MKSKTILGIGTVMLVSLLAGRAAETGARQGAADANQPPAATATKDVSYATDIKPIFEKSCVRCHAAGKAKANLRLDTLESALRGSEGGKVIHPGNSSASQLVRSIAYLGPKDRFMPPPRNKANILPLTKAQIGLIRAWIDQGAK